MILNIFSLLLNELHACRWPKSEWAFQLIPLLTGKARSAYVHMDVELSLNYDHVKHAILQKYDINSETYRQRFCSLQVEPEETPKELYIRLKELYGKWVQPRCKTIEQINEIMILEQYLRMLSPELQVWIKEHDPKTAKEAASLADVFVAARRKNQSWAYKSWKKEDRNQPPAQPVSSVGKPPTREKTTFHNAKFNGKKPTCYLCGQEGHTKPMCLQNPVVQDVFCAQGGNSQSWSGAATKGDLCGHQWLHAKGTDQHRQYTDIDTAQVCFTSVCLHQ